MVRRIAMGVLLATALAGAVSGQESWSDHTAAGEWAFSRGELERCEAEFRSALEIAQTFPEGDRRLETSLSNLARFYEHQGRFNEAQPLYQLLMAVLERRLGPDDPELLDTLFAVGRSSIPIGDAPSAEAALKRYVTVAEASGSDDPGQLWQASALLARILSLQDRQEEALEFQRLAVSALARDSFASDLDRAAQLETLAQLEITNGSAADVESLLDQVVELRAAEVGEDGGGEVYGSAAAAALGAGEPDLAEELALKALAVEGKGPESMSARRVLADVSWLRVRRGSGELADLLAVEANAGDLALAIDRLSSLFELQAAALDFSDPNRVTTLSRLAQTTTMAGDLVAAARWQRSYAEAVADSGGDRAIVAMDGLAYLLTETGEFDTGLEANALLLRRAEQAWGADDARLIPILRRQELLLAELGRKKEAKVIRKRLRKLGG